MASTAQAGGDAEPFEGQQVGNSVYLNRHNNQMFEQGRSFSGNERDKFWINRGDGTYADLSDVSGSDNPNDGRAALAVDFDDDGDLDLFVHHLQRERHSLYRNDLGKRYGESVKVRLRATSGHWEAIGATVTLEPLGESSPGPVSQVHTRGAGFLSCQAPELLFGLGAASSARLQVRWPGGVLETFGEVAAGARVWLVEGSGKAEPFEARTSIIQDPLPSGRRIGIGERVPQLLLMNSDDEQVILDPVALAAGRPLYLNFWASYCAPCVGELPLLQRLHAAGDISVAAISTDAPADSHTAQALLEARGAEFPSFFLGATRTSETKAADIRTVIDLERLTIPTTLVLSPEGIVEEILRGPIRDE